MGTLGGRFWSTLDDFGATLKSLCVHEDYIGSILARFQKTLIFPIDFNDFMELGCQLGAILGSLWGTLGSFWVHFGQSRPKLGPS